MDRLARVHRPRPLPDEAMALRLVREGLQPFGRLVRDLPRDSRGRLMSPSTLYRWATRPTHGVYLEAMLGPGGAWSSSVPAVARRWAAITAVLLGRMPAAAPGEDERQARAARALAEIEALRHPGR